MAIFLVALPANATHLFQPLDVAVFRAFKSDIRQALERLLLTTDLCTITRRDAIQIACTTYQQAIIDKPNSAVSGFAATGIYPPNLCQMKSRLKLSTSGGVRGVLGTAAWLKRRQEEIREEVLTLPPDSVSTGKPARKKRLTVEIAGRLVTKERLLSAEV